MDWFVWLAKSNNEMTGLDRVVASGEVTFLWCLLIGLFLLWRYTGSRK